MVIPLRGQGLSLRTNLLHCKDYIVAVAKCMDSFIGNLFCINSIKLSLNVECVHIKSLRFSVSNEDIIIDVRMASH